MDKKKKEKFELPTIEVIEIEDKDLIITTSLPATPILPFTDYYNDFF